MANVSDFEVSAASRSEMSLQSISNSETDVTVNLTTFEECLMTMMATQEINKSGWMDPRDDWGQIGG